MSLDNEEKSSGKNSLKLEAKRHTACTTLSIPVKSEASYQLNFDYQSPNAKIMSYYIGFNNEKRDSISESVDIDNKEWHSISRTISVPKNTNRATIYLYAKEEDGLKNVINRYDNFSFFEIPNNLGAYFLESIPQKSSQKPKSISATIINPTKTIVEIKGSKQPFFLALNGSFNPKWKVRLPDGRYVSESNHYKLDGFANSWYINPEEFCSKKDFCTRNPDGSFDFKLYLEFYPQKFLYIGMIISLITTSVIILIAIVVKKSNVKKKKNKKTQTKKRSNKL